MQSIADTHGVMLTHDLNDESKPIEKRGVTFYVHIDEEPICKQMAPLNRVLVDLIHQKYIHSDVFVEDELYMLNVNYSENEQHDHIKYRVRYDLINNDLDIIGTMRKQYIDRIQELITEDEVIDLYDDDESEGFRDKCDPAYVSFFDRHMDCTVQEEVNSFSCTEAETDSASVCYEDMTITELMQCYRCIVENKEWKETGKITYE